MLELFEKNFEKTDGCWEWKGTLHSKGYGQGSFNDSPYLAHRLSYELYVGPIPYKHFVCHHCDNRKCVKPSHLFTGTNKDNMLDMRLKGRAGKKLNAENVIEIRKIALTGNYTQEAIGKKFGIKQKAVWMIVNRGTWKHIT
jgi:HNH endonuclease